MLILQMVSEHRECISDKRRFQAIMMWFSESANALFSLGQCKGQRDYILQLKGFGMLLCAWCGPITKTSTSYSKSLVVQWLG